MKATLYTYEVIKGKYKGKTLKSFEPNVLIWGTTYLKCPCFDDDGNEYVIDNESLKTINIEEMEFNDDLIEDVQARSGAI